jgi:ATP/maltotriose-dependent transcriptional regulator MalT
MGMSIMYGPAIHEAIASGETDKMREVLRQAEEHLGEHGNVAAAIETLKAELGKAERSGGASEAS